MTYNNNIYNNEDRYKIEKANRLEALENIVENHTRTERHLEKYSDISSLEKFSDSIVKQADREADIEILECKILDGNQSNSSDLKYLERNYDFAKGYIEHNQDHMNVSALENMKEKQQNRRNELTGLH